MRTSTTSPGSNRRAIARSISTRSPRGLLIFWLESGAVVLASTRLSSLRVPLSGFDKPLDSFAAVSYARADLQELRWLPKEAAAPNRRYGNFQEFRDLVLSQKC